MNNIKSVVELVECATLYLVLVPLPVPSPTPSQLPNIWLKALYAVAHVRFSSGSQAKLCWQLSLDLLQHAFSLSLSISSPD